MINRDYSPIDRFILRIDHHLGSVFKSRGATSRSYPAEKIAEGDLSAAEQWHSAGLMRVNHAGEVSAQALYQGQSLVSRAADIKQGLEQAAAEEADHLVWCEQRLQELGDRTSRLNHLWGTGSFAIGLLAGLAGDRWSLGFVAETERQVVRHLQGHLEKLPTADNRSRVVLEQMIQDETEHGKGARDAGAAELPHIIKWVMSACSKVMTKTAYYL